MLPARYEQLGLLGVGGMGQVYRVRDLWLTRVVAMKVIRGELMRRPDMLKRFVEEAECSAQLQHPGIVPVHDIGRLDDGSVYFTMREVRGRTLDDVIAEVHEAAGAGVAPLSGWTFRRLVDAFVKVCEAVGYAHVRGIVHRDLKPSNVMIGEHGEVLVVDWGIAKVLRGPPAGARPLEPVGLRRTEVAPRELLLGTPAYIPPECLERQGAAPAPRGDVYSLGAVLYEILAGHPAYDGPDVEAILALVHAGPPPPLGRSGAGDTSAFTSREAAVAAVTPSLPPPAELGAACAKAMSRDPHARHANASELAAQVLSWLEGARRREQALEVVRRAAAIGPEVATLRGEAAGLRAEAVELLSGVRPWEGEERKVAAWRKEEEAAAIERRIEALDLDAAQALSGALQIDPVAPEAHAALAERHADAHRAAEAARDDRAVARSEALLRVHLDALPQNHPVRRRCTAYLQGDGALTLITDPPGAEVQLYRHVLRNRRLVPVFERSLGSTPLRTVPLAIGSYVCVISHPNRPDVRYPVTIGRGEHWGGVAPGDADPTPVLLPLADDLDGDCYVPPGWFWSGGDPEAADAMPRRRLWCDGFVAGRFPVTQAQFLEFLNTLVAGRLEALALRWAPRERPGALGEEGALSHRRDARGNFVLMTDAEGDTWLPDWPVFNVDIPGAVAYTRYASARDRRAWRLPAELEWEKAARGVDGRFFPWGDVLDPSWCCMRESHLARPLLVPVGAFPVDQSVYGVRGMAGNIQDWCGDRYLREGALVVGERVVVPERPEEADMWASMRWARRGGSWSGSAKDARCCHRNGYEPAFRNANLGFRMVRS